MNDAPMMIHGICHYFGQWLPGDRRGWRSRHHSRHSSGDYTSPPPPEEHEGLRRYVESRMTQPPVFLRGDQFATVGSAFISKLRRMGSEVRVLSCGPTHVHVLCTRTEPDAIKQLGKAKQYASLKLQDHMGKLWSEGSSVIAVKSADHERRVFNYILDHAEKEHAWIWRCDRDS